MVALLWRVYRVVMQKVSLLDRRVMLSPKRCPFEFLGEVICDQAIIYTGSEG